MAKWPTQASRTRIRKCSLFEMWWCVQMYHLQLSGCDHDEKRPSPRGGHTYSLADCLLASLCRGIGAAESLLQAE